MYFIDQTLEVFCLGSVQFKTEKMNETYSRQSLHHNQLITFVYI